MRRFLFAAFAMIAMALPGCAPAVAPPPPPPLAPPVALLPPVPAVAQWRPALACPDPVTRVVPVYRHSWFHHHRVTRVRLERRIVACNRYHPPSVIIGER